MQLVFKKLEIQNFRIYGGKQEIIFSTDKNKHVTLVHAENSTGKTTMLNAIKWCLYGKADEFTDQKSLVNDRSGKTTCSVRLNFSFDNIDYTAYRTYSQQYTGDKSFTLEKIVNGNNTPISDPETSINRFLPRDLSNYFLFAGEHLTGSLGQGDANKKAIRDILGFNLPETAQKDLRKILRKFTTEKNRILGTIDELTKDAKQENFFQGEIDELDKEIEKIKSKISNYEEIRDENHERIAKSNHLKAVDLQKRIKEKEKQLNGENDIKKEISIKKIRLISEYGHIIFGKKLSEVGLDFIKVERQRIPAPYDQKFVNELLTENTCICGRDLPKGSNEYSLVQSLVSKGNTDTIAHRVSKARSIGDYVNAQAERFLKELKDIESNLKRCENNISTYEQTKNSLNDDLKNIDNEDISEFKKQYDLAVQKISILNQKLGEINNDKKNFKLELEKVKSRLRQGGQSSSASKEIDKQIEITEKCIERIATQLNKTEIASIKKIEEIVQKNLNDILRKEFQVSLHSDYTFELKNQETGRVIRGSDAGMGQTQLTNLSFVTALIAHSKTRANSSSEFFMPGTIAPFVIDAPFGEMDKTYQKGTLSFLPKQSHQLILFLSSGQWDSDYEEIIGNYIGKRYILINHAATNRHDGDIESLTIKGKKFELTKIDDNMSQTTIEDISNA